MKQSTFARKVLVALAAAGWLTKRGTNRTMLALAEVEMLTVMVKHKDGRESFVRFVWQGPDESYEDGEEILSDYGMSLDAVISPLYKPLK